MAETVVGTAGTAGSGVKTGEVSVAPTPAPTLIGGQMIAVPQTPLPTWDVVHTATLLALVVDMDDLPSKADGFVNMN